MWCLTSRGEWAAPVLRNVDGDPPVLLLDTVDEPRISRRPRTARGRRPLWDRAFVCPAPELEPFARLADPDHLRVDAGADRSRAGSGPELPWVEARLFRAGDLS